MAKAQNSNSSSKPSQPALSQTASLFPNPNLIQHRHPIYHPSNPSSTNTMDGLNLSAAEQREFGARMERKQMKEFMNMFSGLVERCFDHCVDDFTTKSLVARETGCVSRCVSKFMAGSERIGMRFQEQQSQMMSGMQQK